MGKYSIKELEKLSGIKAHTLRIWEKRYNIMEPARTETNIRYYSDDDLKKILKVSILNNSGMKISKIAGLSKSDLIENVKQLSEEKADVGVYITELMICMVEFDEYKFEKLLAGYILKLGFEQALLEIVYPFLTKIGILWLNNNVTPVQEHFISNLIRQKIIVAIDGIVTRPTSDTPRVVLFLPENEMHEIGLLFFYYLLKSMGFRTYYLGPDVPLNDLEDSLARLKPHYMITSISYIPSPKRLNNFLNDLYSKFQGINIYLTGHSTLNQSLENFDNLHFFKGATHLKEEFQLLL